MGKQKLEPSPHTTASWFSFEKQSLAVWVTGAVIFVGTMFEVGYFLNYGIEFISLTVLTDWFFAVCVAGLFLLAGGMVFVAVGTIIGVTYRHLLQTKNAFATVVRFLPFSLVAGTAIYLSSSPGPVPAIGLIAAFVVEVSFQVMYIYYRHRATPNLPLVIVSIVVLTGMLSLASGAIYEFYLAGAACTAVMHDGKRLDVTYMRSVGDGHLLKVGEMRYYLPKSEVSSIQCSPPFQSETKQK